MKSFAFNNGDVLQDAITGFKGTVTGRANYLTGCDQYLLVPKVDKEGKHVDGRWIDSQRLKKVGEFNESIKNIKNGADKSPSRNY